MKNKCKRFGIVLCALLLVFSLVACSSQPQPEPGTEPEPEETSSAKPAPVEKVVLNYYGWDDEKTYAEPVIAAFNAENQNIEVQGNFLVASDYYTKIVTMISASTGDLDLLSVNGLGGYNQYQQLGGLADLTDLIQSNNVDLSKYGPSMQELLVDNKYYALPYRSSCYALFYNKDIFDAAGMDYPIGITWDEYATIAKELTSGEGESKIWGGFIPDWMRASLITVQRGSNFLDDDLVPTTEWLVFLDRLYNVDQSHMSFAEMRSRQIDWLKIFESGTVAMLPNGEWTVGLLNADAEAGLHSINWDVAPIPTVNKGDSVKSLGGVSTFVSIYKNSKYIDEAFAFAQFYCGDVAGKIIATQGMLPAYVDDAVKQSFIEAAKVEGADALLSAETYMEAPAIPQMEAIFQAYGEEKELYITGQETIEQFEENFREKRAEALAE